MSNKVAIVEYRRPSVATAGFTVEKDRHHGAQAGLRDDWVVVTSIHGDVAFYPRESVVRAWNEPADSPSDLTPRLEGRAVTG